MMPRTTEHQTGLGLIEVLVAVLLLAMALLGAVALQFATAKEQRSSQFVSRAAIVANELSERMRANRAGIEYGFYNSGSATYADIGLAVANNSAVPLQTCPGAVPCAVAATAEQADISGVYDALRSSLPRASVHLLPSAAGTASLSRDIVVAWVEPVVEKDNNGDPAPLPVARSGCPAVIKTPAGVRCYQMRFVL